MLSILICFANKTAILLCLSLREIFTLMVTKYKGEKELGVVTLEIRENIKKYEQFCAKYKTKKRLDYRTRNARLTFKS